MRTGIGADGIEELREAAAAVGIAVEAPLRDVAADVVLVDPLGRRVEVDVKRVSLVSTRDLEHRLNEWKAHSRSSGGDRVRVVVADRVTEQARHLLRAAGWGWLDLRGHLHLVGDGLFVDVDIPRLSATPDRSVPLTGRVSEEVAAKILLDPANPPSVREIARTLNRAPSSVSEALARMREAGLIDQRRIPVIPDLFWQLAERWHPVQADLQRHPSLVVSPAGTSDNDVLRLGVQDIEASKGWALTDTVAAAVYGAPIGIRSGHPVDFYVPDQATMRRAVHLLGIARSHEERGASIRAAPFPLVCSRRIRWADEAWPLARPLFVALDLARDPGRGRDVLDQWTPSPEAGHRVW